MELKRKKKLIEYLFPSVDTANFLINDFYVELKKVLNKKVCFSIDNLSSKKRMQNLQLAIKTIKDFLEVNKVYEIEIKKHYKTYNDETIIDLLLQGYVFYITPNIDKHTGADVFRDKRSVCYRVFSILDL